MIIQMCALCVYSYIINIHMPCILKHTPTFLSQKYYLLFLCVTTKVCLEDALNYLNAKSSCCKGSFI